MRVKVRVKIRAQVRTEVRVKVRTGFRTEATVNAELEAEVRPEIKAEIMAKVMVEVRTESLDKAVTYKQTQTASVMFKVDPRPLPHLFVVEVHDANAVNSGAKVSRPVRLGKKSPQTHVKLLYRHQVTIKFWIKKILNLPFLMND